MLLAALLVLPPAGHAQDRAGRFDYYVLSLSWSPTWCALTGRERGSPQCDEAAGFGWVLHGLWPQYETGYPEYCERVTRDPSRRETAAMADIMGDGGAAWHQWKKHGRCTGLPPETYFATSRAAFEAVRRPAALRDADRPLRLPARAVEEAFVAADSALFADGVTVTCRADRIQEVRICLDRDLAPRRCGADVIRDCTLSDALMELPR
ncbi:ribonuclease T2 [Palleronia sp. LCG004]|nr:ribonuclease T2 [Palleronia sp. LCG004]WOI57554.1 ribonuclease T2 [Palleronia sp. LCG004]